MAREVQVWLRNTMSSHNRFQENYVLCLCIYVHVSVGACGCEWSKHVVIAEKQLMNDHVGFLPSLRFQISNLL